MSRYADDSNVSYPLFYGTITNLSEEWHQAYGKLIKFQAKDHLQFLNNTSVKQILKTFRTEGETIGGNNDVSDGGAAHRMQSGATQPPIYLDGAKVDDDSDVVETKVSHAIANIVSDFNEGAGFIHTNNQNGADDFGLAKFDDSGFEMTQEELKSGMFKRDLSDAGHKVLRAMQDMAMSERHVTVDASDDAATWAVASTNAPFVVTSSSHGLSNGQTIAVLSCGADSSDATVYVPNGLYLVASVTGNTFQLEELNGTSLTSATTGSGSALSWQGAEDGNFGYDFFLDSGIYGVPDEYGYTIAGGSTNYAPRPHLNYFKRGYRQFRPDATGLNLVSPVEPAVEETGQIRIMNPNAQWETGDDEVMSDVELQITGTEEGNSDKSDLGHNLQLLRIKKLQCCNNVDQFSGAANQRKRLNHAGRWNGEFHWNRHDSFKALDITDTTGSGGWNPDNEPAGGTPPEAQEVQVGANDQAMLTDSSFTSPGWEDSGNNSVWLASKVGRASEGGTSPNMWGGGTLNPGYGTIQDREILRRVLGNDIGGSVLTGNTDEGGIRTSGYAGPSQVPLTGRSFRLGPGAKTKNMEWREPFQWVSIGGRLDNLVSVGRSGTKHSYPAYHTGIVDCDLIKSIKNCEEEGLFEQGTFLSNGPCTMRGDGNENGTTGDVIITMNGGGGHSLQTGAMIKIVSGELHDPTNYWNNYKRVEMAGITGADFPINSFDGVHTASKFYITNLPYEAYEGIEEEGGTIPAASGLPKITWNGSHTVDGNMTFKRVFNVFDGVCRVQYQSTQTRNESPHTDSYVLISDRQRLDVPTMGVEVYAVADEDRISSNGDPSGLTTEAATMPDAVNYPLTTRTVDISASAGLAGGSGRRINGVLQECAVPVSFKKGDKISETRFLFRDENTTTDAPTSGTANCKHLFKNTQAIITQNLMEDKKRAKSQGLTYSTGNDFNEVRRTAAAMLTRSSKDMIRGQCDIIRYPFIKLTGQIASGNYTNTTFTPTQAVTTYGGRAGMLVTKTDAEDGDYVAGFLAEKVSPTNLITGTLSSGNWAEDDWYRMYIHLRAGHSVRCTDPLNGMSSNMIVTKIVYKEGSSSANTTMQVIGYQDLPTGTPVRPLGNIAKAVIENKGGSDGPITLGKAHVTNFSLAAGDSV